MYKNFCSISHYHSHHILLKKIEKYIEISSPIINDYVLKEKKKRERYI